MIDNLVIDSFYDDIKACFDRLTVKLGAPYTALTLTDRLDLAIKLYREVLGK